MIRRLASMDVNNNSCSGVGEREGRIHSALVQRRHWGFAHGIGRSGCLEEVQPKAVGSSCVQRITNKLVKQALKVCGIPVGRMQCVVFPLATGMTLAVVLKAFASKNPGSRYVLMPRIDQKSCVKCVGMAGLDLHIVPNRIVKDALCTDIGALEEAINLCGATNVAAVLTTNSCFAPRVPDDLLAVGRVCRKYGIPHVVNNAYGVQSATSTKNLRRVLESRDASVDAIVQSCDKNFMVPVGGAIVVASGDDMGRITGSYPGRAGITPILDLLITLLSLGSSGLRGLLRERSENFDHFKALLLALPGLRVLETEENDISMAITGGAEEITTQLGAELFIRGISGCRVIVPNGKTTRVGELEFVDWGSHHDGYPVPYFTVAAAIGQSRQEMSSFLIKLGALIAK